MMNPLLMIKNESGDRIELVSRIPESVGPIVQVLEPGDTIHTFNLLSSETFTVRRLSTEAKQSEDK